MGSAGDILGSPDGKREDVHPAAHRAHGSAREDATATLARQFALSKGLYDDIARTRTALDSARALRVAVRDLRGRASGDLTTALDSLDRVTGALEGAGGGFGGGAGGGAGSPTLAGAIGQLGQLYDALQDADVGPTTQLVSAVQRAQRDVPALLSQWDAIRTRAVPALNTRLRALNLPELGHR